MSKYREPSPIALFVYKRPEHTRKTLESLSNNRLLKLSHLFVFADGPKENATEKDLLDIFEVRKMCKAFKDAYKVTVIEHPVNKGLAKNITEGVVSILESNDRIIVLEDDLELSPIFLDFMNESLEIYKNDEKVFHVSGYWFPVENSKKLPETFFLNMATCWGWGTWARAWKKFEKHPEVLKKEILKRDKSLNDFNYGSHGDFIRQLDANIDGTISTWAIKWYGSIYINNGLSLHPNQSFVNNIGHDGTGDNCGIINFYNWPNLNTGIELKKVALKIDRKAGKMYRDFIKNINTQTNYKKNIVTGLKKIIPRFIKKLIRIHLLDRKKIKEAEEFNKLLSMARFCGGKFQLNGKLIEYVDGPSFYFMINEIFKKEIYRIKLDKAEPYFIDAGANIGLATIYLKNLFPKSKIVAFEPDQTVYSTLKKNISTFELSNVELIQKGVWSEETVLTFFSEGADGGRITRDHEKDNMIQIQTVRLSDYIDKEVDLLKIDIEGAEYDVLKEIESKLYLVNNLFIEYHSFVKQNQNISELISILSRAGFRLYIDCPGFASKSPFFQISNYGGMDMQLNIFAYRI